MSVRHFAAPPSLAIASLGARRLIAGLALCCLTACTTLSRPLLTERDQVQAFAIDARFALRHTPRGAPPESAGGRLDWQYRDGESRVLIANPLGMGLAELETRPGMARLTTGDKRQYSGTDAETLLYEVTGQALPIQHLPAWLLGRANSDGQLTRDALGRPRHLQEAGWEIDYEYTEENGNALPQRLHLRRPPDLDLRLRIEEWKSAP